MRRLSACVHNLWQLLSVYVGKCLAPAVNQLSLAGVCHRCLNGVPTRCHTKIPQEFQGESTLLASRRDHRTRFPTPDQPVHRNSPLSRDGGAHSSLVSHIARPVTVFAKTTAIGGRGAMFFCKTEQNIQCYKYIHQTFNWKRPAQPRGALYSGHAHLRSMKAVGVGSCPWQVRQAKPARKDFHAL